VEFLDTLLQFFDGFGPAGTLLFLFTIFFLDALLIPTLPELFVMGFFASRPSFGWAVTLLLVVSSAEVVSNGFFYFLVKKIGLPAFIEKRMKQWVKLLIVSDERVILMNRVAPVIPFMGAFIAAMNWNLRKSLLYVFVGSIVKYGVLLSLVSVLFAYFERGTARNFTLVAIVLVIGISFAQSHYAKQKRFGPLALRVAGAPHGSAAPVAGEHEHADSGADDHQKQKAPETESRRG
jgi:membrane-associated protein